MFSRLGSFAYRRRRWVLAGSALFVLVAALMGTGVFGRLGAGGFADPSAESTRAKDVLASRFGTGAPNLVLLVDAKAKGSSSTPAVDSRGGRGCREHAGGRARGSIRRRRRRELLVARTGRAAAIDRRTLRADRGPHRRRRRRGRQGGPADPRPLHRRQGRHHGLRRWTGAGLPRGVDHHQGRPVQAPRAIAVPITLLLLVLVFGGLVAAGLPLVVGVMSVLGTFFTLWVVTGFTDVSVFSLNLVTALGLGLAIDYSLFIVSRFREELAAGRTRRGRGRPHRRDRRADGRRLGAHGRRVAVGAAGVPALLPAVVRLGRHRRDVDLDAGVGADACPRCWPCSARGSNSLRIGCRRHAGAVAGESGFWHRTATWVMRRPVVGRRSASSRCWCCWACRSCGSTSARPTSACCRPTPRPGSPPTDSAPTSRPTRPRRSRSSPTRRPGYSDSLVVGLRRRALEPCTAWPGSTRRRAGTSTAGGCSRRDPSLAGYRVDGAARFNVVPDVEPISDRGEQLVHDIRALPPTIGPVLVGGASAQLVDSKAAIGARMPLAAGDHRRWPPSCCCS